MRRRVLVVDDDPSLRFLVRQALPDGAWEVVEAESHLAAIDVASRQHLDLVVADYFTGDGKTYLDREDGIVILRGCTRAPLLILTGAYIEPACRHRLLDAGVSEIIIKRPLLEGLEEAMLRAIDGAPRPKECDRA